MSRRATHLLNYGLYQTGWFACVLGAAWHQPWTGFAIAMALIGVHLLLADDRAVESRLILLATLVGAVAESCLHASGTYRVASGTLFDFLPPLWLLAMWGQLATTFRFSLRSVASSPVRAAIFGAAGAPVAFLAGERMGALTLLPPTFFALARIAAIWCIAMVVLSLEVRREAKPSRDPRYRLAGASFTRKAQAISD